MHALMLWLGMFLCGLSVAQAQQPGVAQVPPAAQEVLGRMDKEIVIAKAKAITSLEKIMRDTTKKGDLQGAMAVKQAIDRLQQDVKAGGRAGVASVFVGRWGFNGMVVEFFPDGTAVLSTGDKGRWTENGNSVQVMFDNGITHEMERTAEGYTGVYKQGGTVSGRVTYTRQAGSP